MKLFIVRSDQVRTVKIKKNVLMALKRAVWRRESSETKFCQVSRARQSRVLKNSLVIWARKYKKATKRAKLDKISEEFVKRRFMNKFMTIWVKRLSLKLKKKHL